jgi:transcriptional regulator with XRE-family HTH domain
MGSSRERREALRHFLRTRRARLTPDDVGLLTAGRRHTPGLRREEVAVLAGVSASWYTWLEQGRDIKVSEGVLDAVSGALRLDGTDRAHLYRLAGLNPPQTCASGSALDVDEARLRMVVDGWMPAPAFVVDRYWNTLVANDEARALLGVTAQENYLMAFFGSAHSRYTNWENIAGRLVGQFRVQAARYPGDPLFQQMARRLCELSPRFAELWARHETCDEAMAAVGIHQPGHRRQRFEHVVLGLLEAPDLRLMLYMPHRATRSADLQLLAV